MNGSRRGFLQTILGALGAAPLVAKALKEAPPPIITERAQTVPLDIGERFVFVHDVELKANEMCLNRAVTIPPGYQFHLRGIAMNSDGPFSFRMGDHKGQYLTTGMMPGEVLGQGIMPIFPELVFPAGSRITLDFQETSGRKNSVTAVFEGVRR